MTRNEQEIDYFHHFISKKMIYEIAESTNEYSVQTKGISINVSGQEMAQYIGILIHMGVVCMPDYRMYWSDKTRYEIISKVMSRNRFDCIKSNFHLADNNQLPRNRISTDKLFKFRPLYNSKLILD
jgi:hypothetical protein